MELGITQRQRQTFSHQMIQSTEILQMASQELLQYLETALQENPVLELEEHYDAPNEAEDLYRKLEWLESNDLQNRDYYRQDSQSDADPLRNHGIIDHTDVSLYHHLRVQLDTMTLEENIAACAYFLIASLDGSGWLGEDLLYLAQELHQPEKIMRQALSVVQALEPAGVAARNLSECLCLQLLRHLPVNKLALKIAADHLVAVSKNQYRLIANSLNANQNEVRQACDLIRSLNPNPGVAFAVYENPVYIIPDIIVANSSGQFELLSNDRFFPALTLSPFYIQLLQDSDDNHVQEYLTTKVRQAKWIIHAVEQRQNTLMACVRCILDVQIDFFKWGSGHLKPMSLNDVAKQVGVHESTVCRAVKGKYLQCAKGTYPLSYFFSRRLEHTEGDTSVSTDAAKVLLKRLISQEDKCRPLSDQKLCEYMKKEGCVLARRTVAKYRDELGIPGAAGRRQCT